MKCESLIWSIRYKRENYKIEFARLSGKSTRSMHRVEKREQERENARDRDL